MNVRPLAPPPSNGTRAGSRAKSFRTAVDRCASCGQAAQISPRLEGEKRQWALRAIGWLSLTEKEAAAPGPAGQASEHRSRLLCPHCLVDPSPVVVDLLSDLGVSPYAFANLCPPMPRPSPGNAQQGKTALVRKCASCGRWVPKSPQWTVRLGAELRPGTAKLTAAERATALWYCGSAGCRKQAERRAAAHRPQ